MPLPVEVALDGIELCGGSRSDPEVASSFAALCEDHGSNETARRDPTVAL